LSELQRVLQVQFGERRDLLKSRSALLALDRLVRADGDARGLGRQIERILTGAHEFTELRLLGALRSGVVELPGPVAQEAERLLGGAGNTPAARLGLPADAPREEVHRAAFGALRHWQGQAENPMFGRRAADACRVVVRTCEGILAP
jgi:hypothetical protein